jgi:hypothetical protein
MGFPKAIAEAQRKSVHERLDEAFMTVEELRFELMQVQSGHLLDLSDINLRHLVGHVESAYRQLDAAQALTDPDEVVPTRVKLGWKRT